MEQDPPPPRDPKLPLPIVTIVLVATNIAAWVFSLTAGADLLMPNPELMFDLGGNFGPATLDGESWRLLSSMFLHYGLLHLGMNMFGLGLGGRLVEPAFGRAGFIAIYLFSGLTGGIASAIAGKAVAAGASGAIFGIFGAWPAFLLRHHERFDKETLRKQSTSFAIFLAANLGIGLSSSTIDLRAHIGGLVGGFLAGLVLATHKQHTARVVAVFAASALAIGAAHVIPAPEQTVLLSSARDKFEKFAKLESKALDRYNQLAADEKLTEEEIADVIESEILPVWREGKALVWSAERLPKELEKNLRAYIETRETAWVTMIDALRKKDEKALQEAMKAMSDAEVYIEKLKQ